MASRPPILRSLLAISVLATSALAGGGALAAGPSTPPIPASVQPQLTGDLTSHQWMLDAVRAPQAWTKSTGTGVTVAVIDTGIDSTAPDLQGQVIPGGVVRKQLDGSMTVEDAPLSATNRDRIGHGTHVAGIIAANDNSDGVTGIAPDAKLLPVSFIGPTLDRLNVVSFFDGVTAGVNYAAAKGVDVMNLSLGWFADYIPRTKRNQAIFDAEARTCDAIQQARSAGVVVVVAAGNDGLFLNPSMIPASCNSALSVAAVGPDLQRTFFSSYDPTVQLSAPGLSVLSVASSASPELVGGHVEFSGTSMASPVVAGVAALVKSEHPGYSADQVANALTSTAQDIAPAGRDSETGFGLVDASAAVGAAAPPAQPADYVSAMAVTVPSGRSGWPKSAVISWNLPRANPTTGYTIDIYDSTGTTSTDVDGLQVRYTTDLAEDAWVQVTAHTTSGDVVSFPTPVFSLGGDMDFRRPPPVTNVSVERGLGGVKVSWKPPASHRDMVDKVGVFALFDNRVVLRKMISVDGRFPTQARIKTKHNLAGHDMGTVAVVTYRHEPGLGHIPNVAFARGPFRALRGLAIDHVIAAGPNAAEVQGSIPNSAAERVCDNRTCAGRVVWVKVTFVDTVTQVRTRLTAQGTFHAIIWRPKSADLVSLRAVGPGKTSSGGYYPYRVER